MRYMFINSSSKVNNRGLMSIIKNSNMIRAKAKDPYDYESGWGYLEVAMPLNHPSSNSFVLQFLQRLIQQFSILEQMLSSSPLYSRMLGL